MAMAFNTAVPKRYSLLVYIFVTLLSISHGESLWGVHLPLHAGLGPLSSAAALKTALDTADQDSFLIAARTSPLSIKYSIFNGRSALRDLPDTETHLMDPQLLFGDTCHDELAAHRACAVLLLLRGYADAAHDVILGVTVDNLDEAEYAATHRGQTNWTREHPLTDSADLIHAALHRLEASSKGEGGYKGYENAKYWLAGGPKALTVPAPHSIRELLARIARQHAPCCVKQGIVARDDGAMHTIIGDGSKTRTICVPPGEWDGFIFVDLCEKREYGELTQEEGDEIELLQRAELVLLLRNELIECMREKSEQNS